MQSIVKSETGLAIPGKLTEVGLVLPKSLSFEKWLEVMQTLGRISKSCLWWWGDALVFGEAKYGEKYSQALDETDYDYQTLRDAAWVSNSIELSRRRDSLSWAYHREVAVLEPEQQDVLLDKAASEKWKRNDLRQAVRQLQSSGNGFHPQELPEGTFDIVLADPPWRYDFAETTSREIENQYPTLAVEEICALTPPFADNAVLFMWATAPKLREAMQVLDAWGFTYKTHAVWCKDKIGMGYWFRGQHELLCVATKGEWSPPAAEARHSSWIEAPRGRHSAKPEEVYELIESMFPEHKNRLELFARGKREGWVSWGNQ